MRAIGAVVVIVMACPFVAAAPCETLLSSLALPNTSITIAEVVPAGKFPPPPRPGGGRNRGGNNQAGNNPAAADQANNRADDEPETNIYATLPAFCRIGATIRPVNDSEIKIEVWMPATGWNRKLLAVGNGAWAGSMGYDAMAAALAANYASASTDTGHSGRDGDFMVGHPEKLVDFSHRAVHELAVASKAIIAGFYGDGPRLSYFRGCSTGGRQALTAAQRYPLDFDGIIAGASAINSSRLHAAQLWFTAQNQRDNASQIPDNKLPAIRDAVLQSCDALDGLKDGLVSDPRQCKFDPAVLTCKAEDSQSCLTPAQVETVRRIHAGPGNFPGLPPGSESGWGGFLGWLTRPIGIANDHYRYIVFENPEWDFKTIDVQRDVAAFDKAAGPLMNSSNPDLRPFFNNGGKLIMYHGWADPGIPPLNSVEYYSSVVKTVGPERSSDSIRLYMMPGVGHCSGGDGPSTFDPVTALDSWRDQGKAPASLLAERRRRGILEMSRPLCPFPQVAQYSGSGSINEAANFVCK